MLKIYLTFFIVFAILYGINVFFGRLTKLEKIRLFKTLAKLFALGCLTIFIISTIVSIM